MTIKIGSRCSALALIQAKQVKDELKDCVAEIVPIKTSGDKIKGSLAEVGGKGLFVKELEEALLNGKIDLAVHSMKDVPGRFHEDLMVVPILKREKPNDVFISYRYKSLEELPHGSTIGTCAPRRIAILGKKYNIIPIRGNIETRLKKAQDLDGIILAYCALKRLDKTGLITEILDIEKFIPAVGQGALAAQFHRNNKSIEKIINNIVDYETKICVEAEREFLKMVDGDCTTPLGAFAELKSDVLYLRAMLADGNDAFFALEFGESYKEVAIAAADKLIKKVRSTKPVAHD